MTTRVCEREVWIPAPIEEVFAFFSDAHNLEKLTPPYLKFNVLTPHPIKMQKGALIDYKLSLRGLPMTWKTEITDWVPGVMFADNQLKGPYKKWYHTHRFESKDGGTLMKDRIEYIIPGGFLEPLIYPFVKKDVESIFDFRTKVMNEMFKPKAS